MIATHIFQILNFNCFIVDLLVSDILDNYYRAAILNEEEPLLKTKSDIDIIKL